MTKSIKIDNCARTVSVGDTVGYKYDIESVGKVIKFEGNILMIETDDEGFHQIVQEEANRCWQVDMDTPTDIAKTNDMYRQSIGFVRMRNFEIVATQGVIAHFDLRD